jgi:hypothetical protein
VGCPKLLSGGTLAEAEQPSRHREYLERHQKTPNSLTGISCWRHHLDDACSGLNDFNLSHPALPHGREEGFE